MNDTMNAEGHFPSLLEFGVLSSSPVSSTELLLQINIMQATQMARAGMEKTKAELRP
jgi:hypothetical protein